MPSPAIFISYRRADAAGHAGRLHDRLRQWFAREDLFFDQESIESGANFPERIAEAVTNARAILVIIAPGWLNTLRDRATNSAEIDFVRQEVALALARLGEERPPNVVPVLLGGAEMPKVTDLSPFGLEDLSPIQEHKFTGNDVDWQLQFGRLKDHCARESGLVARPRRMDGTFKPMRLVRQRLSPHFQDPGNRLIELRQALVGSRSAAVIASAAVYGMGGLGKTQLAIAYSLTWAAEYEGVWWFGAETEQQCREDAYALCDELGIPRGPNQGDVLDMLIRRLENMTTPWLLVYDNAESAQGVRNLMPQRGPHHLLFTSRDPAWRGVASPIALDVWSAESGANFLSDRLGGQVQNTVRAALEGLSEDLGGLPLALEQAAAYIEQCQCTVAEYRQLVADVNTAGLMLDEQRSATGYEASVARTLSVAFPKLPPDSQALLCLCAFFGGDPILERWFKEGRDDLPPVLQAACGNPKAWNDTRHSLLRFGLATKTDVPDVSVPDYERTPDQVESALVLHRLTAQVVRHRLAEAEREGPVIAKLVRRAMAFSAEDPKAWPRLRAIYGHAAGMLRPQSPTWLSRRDCSALLDRLGSYARHAQSDFNGSKSWYSEALQLDQVDLGDEHPDSLTSMNNLAVTLQAQGDLVGARMLQEGVVAVRQRVLGEEHPDTLTSMNNLALTLQAQGDLAGARMLEEQALAVRQRVLGEEHPNTLTSMNNLAATLGEQGDLVGARMLEEQVLAVRQRVLGEEHPGTLTSMNNLAATLRAQGDLIGARMLQEGVVAVRQRVLGEEHPDTLASMNNLAGTLGAQGDLVGARMLQERVAAVCQRVLGEEHPGTLTSMNNLAGTLRAQGELAGARMLQERVMAVRQRVLGEEHPGTLTSMNNLAATLRVQGDHVGAQTLQERVLTVRQRVLGKEHPATLTSMNNLALTLQAQGDLAGARTLQEKVLAVSQRVLGEEHPDTLTSMNNLAGTLLAQGDRRGARGLWMHTHKGLIRKLGADHEYTKSVEAQLAALDEEEDRESGHS
ncbi:MAG: tetratricopeptide repeat protein [Betaproteobacteria bacterium]|nr:tetratricopeptide repeat protein [Betaproteobacteria bacterium]